MITDIQFLEASNSIELDYISLYANTFLNIKSDYIYDNLHFSITFKNNQNNKSYTINSYAEANVNEVSIYLKKILQIIQSQYYELNNHYFTINILIKEYHNNEYIDEVLKKIKMYIFIILIFTMMKLHFILTTMNITFFIIQVPTMIS